MLMVTGSLRLEAVVVLRQPAGAVDGPSQRLSVLRTMAMKPVVRRMVWWKV
jgi:hypothetical protein